MSPSRKTLLRSLASSPQEFSSKFIGIPLRPYQQQVADLVLHSVLDKLGLSFVVIFPRQSGKNETQAHIQAFLLFVLQDQEIEIISVSPTYKPQALNAMNRLQRCLDRNPLTAGFWHTRSGITVCLGRACVHFFSGSSVAHTVGATASALLSIDEAQDIRLSTYDRKFAPMVASTNATRLFWGTPWTSSTLLSREARRAEYDQKKDGIRRLWTLTADDVALAHPLYGEFVSVEVSRYGRTHPYVKTQYFSEEIDSQGSMFNPSRLLLMSPDVPSEARNIVPSTARDNIPSATRGTIASAATSQGSVNMHSPPICSENGGSGRGVEGTSRGGVDIYAPPICSENGGSGRGVRGYAFLLDVAGQDESRMSIDSDEAPLENPSRDSAALSIASVDLSTLSTLHAPTYRIVHRQGWTGINHLTLFGQLKALAGSWHPVYIVMDATGVGEGLWALLDKAFPTRVIPVKFNQQVKSEIGWKFLSIINTGRFHNCVFTEPVRLQYAACRSEVLPGPAKSLRWGVPEGARGPDGQLIHDDFLLADSLVALLDTLEWHISGDSIQIDGDDPLDRISFSPPWSYLESMVNPYSTGRRRY